MSLEYTKRWLADGFVDQEQAPVGDIQFVTTTGFIVWFVFVTVCCGLPMVCCCVAYLFIKIRQRHDPTEIMVDEDISRMEANIHVFSQQQELRRKKVLLTAFAKHTTILIDVDKKLADNCSICLGKYQSGHVVVQSQSCQHVFHKDCIVAWLMTRHEPLCPCCRQVFLPAGMDDSSHRTRSIVSSDEEPETLSVENEQSRMDAENDHEQRAGAAAAAPASATTTERVSEGNEQERCATPITTQAASEIHDQEGRAKPTGELNNGGTPASPEESVSDEETGISSSSPETTSCSDTQHQEEEGDLPTT